jgi:hypothetical protein
MLCFPVRDGSSLAHRTRAHAINPKAPFCLITPWVTTTTMAFKFHTVVNLHIISDRPKPKFEPKPKVPKFRFV